MKYEDMNFKQRQAVNKKCRTCRYSWTNVETPVCLYALDKKERRGCDPDNCDKYEKRTRSRNYTDKGREWSW